MLRAILAALAASVISSVALAQSTVPKPVSVTGLIEKTPGPFSICQQGETHRIACTDVHLKSSSVDLSPFVGKIVTVIGKDVSVTCTVIDVSQVNPVNSTLSMCGAPNLGCPIKVQICPSGAIGVFAIFASTGSDYLPINLTTGTFLLAAPFVQLAGGFQQFPCSGFQVTIPQLPPLVGVDVHMQGFLQDVGPVGPPVLTNSICFTIGAMGLCTPIGC